MATTSLPAEGRQGDPPAWPLGKPTRREAELWQRLWRSPQAVIWERAGLADVVARYARVRLQADRRAALGVALAEARQLEDRLGLNAVAMQKLRWTIDDSVDVEESAGQVVDIRTRLKAID